MYLYLRVVTTGLEVLTPHTYQTWIKNSYHNPEKNATDEPICKAEIETQT